MDKAMGGLGGTGPPKIYFFSKKYYYIYIYMGRGVQRVEDLINPPESDRPEAQRVDPKSIASRIRFYL